MFCDQEFVFSFYLVSQGSFRKFIVEYFSRFFKEIINRWVRNVEDFQCYVKLIKNMSFKEQFWGRQFFRWFVGRVLYQENDGYCLDLELSDLEVESDGNKEKVRVRKDSLDRENFFYDFRWDCYGKSKIYFFFYSLM